MGTPICVSDYDASWPQRYDNLAEVIRSVAGTRIPHLEHIGSTAVPGCAAKPIIDIMGGVTALADADAARMDLESIGYSYVDKYEDVMPYRRYFVQPGVHLHVVETRHEFWARHLASRDWLRTHDSDRDAYAALKREFAARFRYDGDGYTEAKTTFVRSIERRAIRGYPAP